MIVSCIGNTILITTLFALSIINAYILLIPMIMVKNPRLVCCLNIIYINDKIVSQTFLWTQGLTRWNKNFYSKTSTSKKVCCYIHISDILNSVNKVVNRLKACCYKLARTNKHVLLFKIQRSQLYKILFHLFYSIHRWPE